VKFVGLTVAYLMFGLLECESGLVIPDAEGERSAVIVEDKESRKNDQNWETEHHQPSDTA